MKKRTLLAWSSGKDSAWALHVLRQQLDINVVGLFCTINQKFKRVAMHAIRIELIQQQAESVGLPVQIISIPHQCSNSEYKIIMDEFVGQAKRQGIEYFAFGDLFLEDVRKYRESNLTDTGITPIFPLWEKPTNELSKEMVGGGLRAIITCVDTKHLPSKYAGREYNTSFLKQIPEDIDPCGEYGEFHSFVFDGPMFKKKISICVGKTVFRNGFVFTDLLSDGA